jgi:hypothetical protein
MSKTSKVLLDSHPLVFNPELATAIGLSDAIILQQVHYWAGKSKHKYDGRTWIYNSVTRWQEQFPFFSYSTIRRTLERLEMCRLLVVGNYNRDRRDRTKWFAIDYERLEARVDYHRKHPSKRARAIVRNEQMQCDEMSQPLPETTTETTGNLNREIRRESSPTLSSHKEVLEEPQTLTKDDYTREMSSVFESVAGHDGKHLLAADLQANALRTDWNSQADYWVKRLQGSDNEPWKLLARYIAKYHECNGIYPDMRVLLRGWRSDFWVTEKDKIARFCQSHDASVVLSEYINNRATQGPTVAAKWLLSANDYMKWFSA